MAAVRIRDLADNAGFDDACDHLDAEPFASGGSATYFRCGCGVILVLQGGRVWEFPPRSR